MKRGAMLVPLVLTAVLTACGSGSSGGAKSSENSGGGPPKGGWPQPVNGQLTPQMCGLLTDADYAKYGHTRLPVISQKRLDNAPNAIDCLYTTSDELDIGLQPTAEAAKTQYAAGLKDHKERLTEDSRPTVLATNVVQGADESWFDYWTLGTANSQFKEYEISVRRGSLVVGIVLSGLKGKNEKDPRTVLTGLAGLVLQRIPNVGRTDTGKTHKAEFAVAGAGRAKQIVFNDPTSGAVTTLKNVKLPWHVEKPLINYGQAQIMLNLTAVSGTPMAAIGCNISVDGKTVVQEDPKIGGFANCSQPFTPPK
ncbi:hypothetical protein [Actinoallomurus iriomotensis]|nr:hypothetical protein [Actinoallomurus iriomotensis]